MKRNTLMIMGSAVALFMAAGCIVAIVDYSDSRVHPRGTEFRRVFPLKPGGTVMLENGRGNIEIRGWERNEVEVYALREMLRPQARNVRVYSLSYSEPKIAADRFDDFIRIKTRYARGDRDIHLVDYSLNVPSSVNLRDIKNEKGNVFVADLYGKVAVDLGEGSLRVENFSGSLAASVSAGPVEAELLDLRAEDEVKITTGNGDIIIWLQPGANVRVEADAPAGVISSDFDLGQPLPADKLAAQMGESGAFIRLFARRGDIQIKRAEVVEK